MISYLPSGFNACTSTCLSSCAYPMHKDRQYPNVIEFINLADLSLG